MKYYLDLNMRNGEILIAQTAPSKPAYYIVFKERYKADQVLKKLNAGLLKSPLENLKDFEVLRVEKTPLGEVIYYSNKTL